jgi:hypothetical protein
MTKLFVSIMVIGITLCFGIPHDSCCAQKKKGIYLNKNNEDDKSDKKKSKKNKKKKSAEKMLYLILGSAAFQEVGNVQALSSRDISNTTGINEIYVNAAINDAYRAGVITPTIYNNKYYISTNDMNTLMDYLSGYLKDSDD